MKKFYHLVLLAFMAITATTFTSCDEDTQIALTLEGVWQGNMYVSASWNGRDYYATSTEITFEGDDFHWSHGTGYWADYYSGAPWDYVANHIQWRVVNRSIEVYFIEEGTTVYIEDYSLSDNYFSGYIQDGDNDVEFRLRHVASPRRSSYDYWGYDGWNHYYSRETRSANSLDSVCSERPVRHFGKQK